MRTIYPQSVGLFSKEMVSFMLGVCAIKKILNSTLVVKSCSCFLRVRTGNCESKVSFIHTLLEWF